GQSHRPAGAAMEASLCARARGGAGPGDTVLRRIRVGANMAPCAAVPRGADVLQLLLSLAGGRARAGRGSPAGTRAGGCVAPPGDESHRPGLWSHLSG